MGKSSCAGGWVLLPPVDAAFTRRGRLPGITCRSKKRPENILPKVCGLPRPSVNGFRRGPNSERSTHAFFRERQRQTLAVREKAQRVHRGFSSWRCVHSLLSSNHADLLTLLARAVSRPRHSGRERSLSARPNAFPVGSARGRRHRLAQASYDRVRLMVMPE